MIPSDFDGRYFEPFLGAGALFFALRPAAATISDANAHLMLTYRVIRDQPEGLEDALRELATGAEAYYAVRASIPEDDVGIAARTFYLATNGFNGIYRVNRNGDFNVPYGGREYVLGNPGSLRAHSEALRGAEILTMDFEEAVADAREGDLVYLDPPYTVAHSNNGFLKYNGKIFSWLDQERLAATATMLAGRGCMVIVSSAYHESTSRLFRSLRPIPVARLSTISAVSKGRGLRREYMFTNIPIGDADRVRSS